jgi:PAS domain S-box-containing protein
MTEPASRPRRILIVEDEGIVAADIEKCLEDAGFEVTGIAASADDAITEASKTRPDLVLLDIRIQGDLDGIAAGNVLHRRFGMPIVYLTAHGDAETIERAKESEPLAFLLKPFTQAELISTIEIAMSRAVKERELRERERSFFVAMESIGDAVLSTDEQGRVRFLNRSAEALTGWSQKDALGRPIGEIVRIADEQARAGISPLAPDEAEYRIASRDGAFRWVMARSASIAEPDSRSTRVVVIQDITRRRESERLMRRQADLLEQSHEPILTWETDGAIRYWNRGAEVLYGFSSEEAVSFNVHELLRTVETPDVLAALARDGNWKGELTQTTKDGREITVESLMVTEEDAPGCRTVLETNRDITERKWVEKEMRELVAGLEQRVHERTAQLEAANKELEAFAYSVSHDLRAPLRGIDGWSLALLEDYGGRFDEQGRQYLDRIRSEAQRMGILIDDLFKLSRVARSEMLRGSVDLTSIAEGIAARLREAHPARRIEFVIAKGLNALGDAHLLEIVMTNLMDNAVKFTARQAEARIEFGEIEHDGAPAFYLRDNGVGFDMAYADTLFGPFQRLHKASDFPGTGIGLTTVQRIAHRHGGRVWAESEPDHGATFYFELGTQNGGA